MNGVIKCAVQAGYRGILLDDYPRHLGQLRSLDARPFDKMLQRSSSTPDFVVHVCVSEVHARLRHIDVSHLRDGVEKFQPRFDEYQCETLPVLETYRKRGTLVEVDADGTKQEAVAELERVLAGSSLWKSLGLVAGWNGENS